MYFEHDVFISYRHLNNRDDQLGQNGWVAQFEKDLKRVLDDLLEREARIWRDNKMPFGTVLSDAISTRLRKTKLLVCIISPAYAQSDWCLRELREFRRAAQQTGGLTVGDQSRIIAVVKTPTTNQPEGLIDSLQCSFYDATEDRGGVPRPFSQTTNGYKHEQYEERLNEIAWAIKQLIETLGEDPLSDISRTIYLAETSGDRREDRDKIQDELEAREFVVIPNAPLPRDQAGEYCDAVRENLERAFMSIHLFGANYGLIPEGADGKSLGQIQNELASERSSQNELFKRVIWIPENLANLEAKQTEFLDDLRKNEKALIGAVMVEQSREDLKTRILQILAKKSEKDGPSGSTFIYLIYDRLDVDLAEPVGRFLFEKGYDVIFPPEKGGLRYHKSSLLRCDAALTIYGKARVEWVQDRYDDVVTKVKGWGREKGISCTAILPTDPETPHKSMLFFHRTKVLQPCYNGLSKETLEKPLNEFIDELEQALRV
jgi:hypothetical protein